MDSISSRILRYFLLATALEGFTSFILLLSLPKSVENDWLFGYSFNRVILILGMFFLCLGLAWFTFNTWRKTEWQERIQTVLKNLLARDNLLDLVLVILSASFVIFAFLLFLWSITEDVYHLAYLTRFGPVLLFGALVVLQTFGISLLMVPCENRALWVWSLLFGSALMIFQGWSLIWYNKLGNAAIILAMFAGTFYAQGMFRHGFKKSLVIKIGWILAILLIGLLLLSQLLFIPKKFLFYRQSLFIFSPMILMGFAVITHMADKVLSAMCMGAVTRRILYLFVLVGFIFAGNQYYLAGNAHANQVNTTYMPNDDEQAFMEFAAKVHDTGFRFTGWRNQMPIYPYIQALFYGPSMTFDEFFERGKEVNIALSLISLAVIFIVVQRFLLLYQAVSLTLLISFGLYVFKSGYILVETLYYMMGFLAYLLVCILLIKPSLKWGIVTGIVLGIGHLTKASILPALFLFIGVFLLKEFVSTFPLWKKECSVRAVWNVSKANLANLGAVLTLFIIVISPYGLESKKMYGSFFYNLNNDFLWYDSYEEAIQGPSSADISPMVKYFQEHNLSDIWDRIEYGLYWQTENIRYQYGFFNYPVFLTMFLVLIILLDIKQSSQLIKKYFFVLLFAALYFAAYFFLCIWYSPIANMPRFLYVMYVPLSFSIFIVAKEMAGDSNYPLIKMTNLALYAMVMIDIWHTLSRGPFFRDFGS
ncbi:MAG: hypothetical protein FJZ86_04025 [Chloroflexi bacterium]|nr:hypothetical protein [Chloroflexota bacterium]